MLVFLSFSCWLWLPPAEAVSGTATLFLNQREINLHSRWPHWPFLDNHDTHFISHILVSLGWPRSLRSLLNDIPVFPQTRQAAALKCWSPALHASDGRLAEDAPRPRGATNHGNNLPKYFRSTTRFKLLSFLCHTVTKPRNFLTFPSRRWSD